MLPLLIGAPFSFTSECTVVRTPARPLEAPLISTLKNSLDFLGLHLLTPMCTIFLFVLEIIELQFGLARYHHWLIVLHGPGQ